MKPVAAALAVALLAGCAANSILAPLQSAWYLQFPPNGSSAEVEIGLLNRSPRPIVVAEVILNRAECSTGAHWRRRAEFTLAPGQLAVLKASEFTFEKESAPCDRTRPANDEAGKTGFSESCLVPVSVAVRLKEDSRSRLERFYAEHFLNDEKDLLQVELIGRMPSAIPDNWDRCRKTLPPAATSRNPGA